MQCTKCTVVDVIHSLDVYWIQAHTHTRPYNVSVIMPMLSCVLQYFSSFWLHKFIASKAVRPNVVRAWYCDSAVSWMRAWNIHFRFHVFDNNNISHPYNTSIVGRNQQSLVISDWVCERVCSLARDYYLECFLGAASPRPSGKRCSWDRDYFLRAFFGPLFSGVSVYKQHSKSRHR